MFRFDKDVCWLYKKLYAISVFTKNCIATTKSTYAARQQPAAGS